MPHGTFLFGALLLFGHAHLARSVDPTDLVESLKNDDESQGKAEAQTEYPNGVNVIPGEPDVDYPVYNSIKRSSFSCVGRSVGFYADVELRCQVWHICDTDSRQQSFLCTNGTIYSQSKRVCDWWYNVNCDERIVTRHYERNKDLYKDGPPPETKNNKISPDPFPNSERKPIPNDFVPQERRQPENRPRPPPNPPRNEQNFDQNNFRSQSDENIQRRPEPRPQEFNNDYRPRDEPTRGRPPPPQQQQQIPQFRPIPQEPKPNNPDSQQVQDLRPQFINRPNNGSEPGFTLHNINNVPIPIPNLRGIKILSVQVVKPGPNRGDQNQTPPPPRNNAQASQNRFSGPPPTRNPGNGEDDERTPSLSHLAVGLIPAHFISSDKKRRPQDVPRRRPPPQPEQERLPPQQPSNNNDFQQNVQPPQSPPIRSQQPKEGPPPQPPRQQSQDIPPPRRQQQDNLPARRPPQDSPQRQENIPPRRPPQDNPPQRQENIPPRRPLQDNQPPRQENPRQVPQNVPPPPIPKPSFVDEPERPKFRHSTPRKHNVKFAPSPRRSEDDDRERQVPEESQRPSYSFPFNIFNSLTRTETVTLPPYTTTVDATNTFYPDVIVSHPVSRRTRPPTSPTSETEIFATTTPELEVISSTTSAPIKIPVVIVPNKRLLVVSHKYTIGKTDRLEPSSTKPQRQRTVIKVRTSSSTVPPPPVIRRPFFPQNSEDLEELIEAEILQGHPEYGTKQRF